MHSPNQQRLSQTRCQNHPDREAVARCPQCTGYFCRECVTEHENRVLCSSCLMMLHRQTKRQPQRYVLLWPAAQLMIGLFLLWTVFYTAGRILLLIPSSFHEGTVWQEKSW